MGGKRSGEHRNEDRGEPGQHPEIDTGPITQSEGPGSDGRDAALTTDDVFEILKNERRRAVLRYLRSNDGCAELSDLAEHIAATENNTTVDRLPSQARKRVYIALYQCHLPKMKSVGVVEYDQSRGTIELLESAAELERHMEPAATGGDAARPPDRLVPAFAAAVVALVVAGTFGLGPLSTVPAAGWTLVSVAAIVVIVGVQYRHA